MRRSARPGPAALRSTSLDSSTSGQIQKAWAAGRSRPTPASTSSICSWRHGAGGDGRAAGRLLGQTRDVEVAVDGQFQGPRDGGRGHGDQQGGRRRPWPGAAGARPRRSGAARRPRPVARSAGRSTLVLEQGVGADGDPVAPSARPASFSCAATPLSRPVSRHGSTPAGPRRHDGLESAGGRGFRSGPSGRSGGGGLRRRPHGQHGDHGLAGADVALDQPRHPGRRRPGRRGSRPGLRPCAPVRPKGRAASTWLDRRPGAAGSAGRAPTCGAALRCGHGQLVGQELVIGQPPPGRGDAAEVALVLRRVQPLQRRAPARPAAARRARRRPAIRPARALWLKLRGPAGAGCATAGRR